MGSYKYCLCFTRKFRWSEAQPPPDVRTAFEACIGTAHGMTTDQLRRFLLESQGEPGAEAERLVEQVRQLRRSHVHLPKLARPLLSLDDFHHFLLSVQHNPPLSSQVHHDMDAPLSHYFIYTGHNSYLTGNQLSSASSDVPIIKALQRGVRVIELDLWPNSSEDDVDVLHGRTLTSPVDLIKCLRSIKDYAFCASPYPLIITLEDHLTPDLQDKVAKMVTQTFGDMLYYPDSESLEEFPSPESLKNRIILSTKLPKTYPKSQSRKKEEDEPRNGKDRSESEDESDEQEDDTRKGKDQSETEDDSEEEEEVDDDDDDDDNHNIRRDSALEYKRIIAITAGKPKGPLRDSLKVGPGKVRRLSLSERQFKKAAASDGVEIVRFTQKNLLRVYPNGIRFNSSNYNPRTGWMHGVQMLAFNMQGYGKSLWLMHGFFKANGGCGYVKKPDFLLNAGPHGEVFDPKQILPVKKTLKIKVYMGDGWRMDFKQTHFDAYSPPDFFTRVGIAGVRADTVMKKTRIIEDDWTPVWDEEFTFPLTVPELALLRIEVREYGMPDKDEFAGQNCLPVAELRPGIRAVPLFDRKGRRFKSVKLLVRLEFV